MSETFKRMTKLQAVNMMLTTIGEQPIENLDDKAGLQDASIAEEILNNTSRQVQSKGWVFNMEYDKIITLNSSDEAELGDSYLRVDTSSKVRSSTTDVVERDGKLYDRIKKTYKFDDAVTVDIVKYISFDALPEIARRYISVKAARIFHDRVVGSGELHRFFQEDELQAWSDLLEYQSEVGDFTIFDDYGVFRVLDRNRDTSQQYAWRK